MRRDWDLIRGLLRAIDIDYDLYERSRLMDALAKADGIGSLNYHLCLLYEARLVSYSRPFYSKDSYQLEVEPIQLTKEGSELFSLMRDDSVWLQVRSYFGDGEFVSASQSVLVSALKKHFLSATIAVRGGVPAQP
jgi:Hypothetical protein (DUF2513)